MQVSEWMFWLTSLELPRDQAFEIAPLRRRVADDEHAGHLLTGATANEGRSA
jgi:hypothetical protein